MSAEGMWLSTGDKLSVKRGKFSVRGENFAVRKIKLIWGNFKKIS